MSTSIANAKLTYRTDFRGSICLLLATVAIYSQGSITVTCFNEEMIETVANH